MATKLHLRLKSLEDDDPWIVEQKNFAIRKDFLQPDSYISPADAAFQINELTPMKREAQGEEDVEHPESYMWEIWGFFIEISKQIPHDHPSQDKLVSLIKELTLLPSVEVEIWGPSDCVLQKKLRVWADLPLMGAAWTEAWDEPSDYDDSYEAFKQGINWHAFSARLLQSGLTRWFMYAVRIFRLASEEEPYRKKDTWEYRICAAAQWIEHSRQAIFQKLDSEFSTKELNQMAEGPLYKGKEGMSHERWDFWEAEFRAFGGERAGEVSEETASIYRKAAQQMTETGLMSDE
ncbi:hypothetical protein ASPZODRAFT_142250 [Penicilliopsis zonata CBS 506.65]|uniref:Uncharacterized protein n=1 Tax=Penicilliopsis zonata CBS 506.65 TaxID=1073090 RepID=A0A1L9SH19_9EURO|nr:hypothetical protein ASPZODRAFT_142250 [Penicilliopsis zonata CBS 506.65]OJJ46433.1 hypothetical protein ASPZODRAFT_142250 [Penicilliopsis zonata CBS 506.65]